MFLSQEYGLECAYEIELVGCIVFVILDDKGLESVFDGVLGRWRLVEAEYVSYQFHKACVLPVVDLL